MFSPGVWWFQTPKGRALIDYQQPVLPSNVSITPKNEDCVIPQWRGGILKQHRCKNNNNVQDRKSFQVLVLSEVIIPLFIIIYFHTIATLNSILQQKLSSLIWHLNWKSTCARSDISHQETDGCVWSADKDHLWSGRWTRLRVFRQNQDMKQKLPLSNLHTHKKSSLGENIWKIDESRLRPYETLYLFSSHKSSKRYSERFLRNNLTWHFFSVTSRTCIHLFFSYELLKSSQSA